MEGSMTESRALGFKSKMVEKQIMINGIPDFSLGQTLECGQCFRWEAQDSFSHIGVVGHRVAKLTWEPEGEQGSLRIQQKAHESSPEDETFWRHYLDLDRDYGKIKRKFCRGNQAMKEVIRVGQGIHVLHQDPWEALVSFIISQNNHIPRIKASIQGLCQLAGTPLGEAFGSPWYAFPEPKQLASLTREDLAPLRLGYRDEYILRAAQKVQEDGVDRLLECGQKSPEEALQYLCSFHGVGKKVAHCTMLYGLGHRSSFPLDVWMKRVMHQMYHISEQDERAMEAMAARQYGVDCGIAQQYLFYHITQSKKK